MFCRTSNNLRRLLDLLFSGALALGLSVMAGAQENPDRSATPFRSDTLSLRIEFPSGVTEVRADYGDNGASIGRFREALSAHLGSEGAFMSGVFIRTAASPDGSTEANIRLSAERSEAVRSFVCQEFGLSPFIVYVTSDGENWSDLASLVEFLSADECPWRDEALAIIREGEDYDFDGKGVTDTRKRRLQALAGGEAWRYMKAEVFPRLRAAFGDAYFVISTPLPAAPALDVSADGQEAIRDTVWLKEYVEVEYNGKVDRRFAKRVENKSFLFSIKTNIFAVPLLNAGIEFPFSERFSVEFDFYYPFIKRNALHKDCTEMLAYDMAVRYWLPNDRKPSQARLLGHSFGIYGAGGHYDFEREWLGHQGSFFNVGFDWKYAWQVLHGSLHMEIELGLGMIYSDAQPYEVYDEYGKAFRIPGERRIIRWYGPTRVQLNIVVPFYSVRKNYRREAK